MTSIPLAPDPDFLAGLLESGLARHLARPVRVLEVRLLPFTGSSSFAAWRAEARLEDGREIPVFVKNLDPAHQLEEAKLVRDASLERSRREVAVYRDVLEGLGLGTPAVYGVHWDEPDRSFWLLLEDAGPKRLSRLGDFELWVDAARWLGDFHAVVRRPSPGWNLPPLRLDELRSRSMRVADLLGRVDIETRTRLETGLGGLDAALERLVETPWGMIHGEYFGKNVVIRPQPVDDQIAVIDWETAGVGPQYLDLVSITAGRWTHDQRRRMQRAYFDAVTGHAGARPSWERFQADVDAAALVNAYAWLGWWSEGDDAHIRRWSTEAVFAADQVAARTEVPS